MDKHSFKVDMVSLQYFVPQTRNFALLCLSLPRCKEMFYNTVFTYGQAKKATRCCNHLIQGEIVNFSRYHSPLQTGSDKNRFCYRNHIIVLILNIYKI